MRKIDTVLICGAVDDGKSTLAGRLLYESRLVASDVSASARAGRDARDGLPDFAYLMDGLIAEREQAITIDVAWRHCWLGKKRCFLVDAPGHEEHTRNMAAAASFADHAIVTVDVARGVTRQTRRHTAILSLLGVRSIVLAVNKMDAVDFAASAFEEVAAEYLACARELGFATVECMPISALGGDNVVASSARMPWYRGATLAAAIEALAPEGDRLALPRLPVQWVCRTADYRGYCGTVAAGVLRRGDRVRVLPSGRAATVKQLHGADGELEAAYSGTAINLTLDQDVDVARGDVLVVDADQHPGLAMPALSDRIEASLVWLSESPLQIDSRYEIRVATSTAAAWVRNVFGHLDLETMQITHAHGLAMNEIGRARLHFDRPLVLDLYSEDRTLGGFVLLDRLSNETVALGMVDRILPSSRDVVGPESVVTPRMRADLLGQAPRVIWLTGLSGSGKSTLAAAAERILHARGRLTFLLDGDLLRSGLSDNLGFTDADREENIRRAAEAAKLLYQAGAVVLVALISPFRAERERIRSMFPPGDFIEAYVSAPLEICEARDPKGLYRRARSGQLRRFTGVDSPYEPPEKPDLVFDTAGRDIESCVTQLVETVLQGHGQQH